MFQEIISGAGHSSAVDWWALGNFLNLSINFSLEILLVLDYLWLFFVGILLYEMFYGYTPFRGKTRQRTFANVLHKDLKFPGSIPVRFPKHACSISFY